MSSGIRKVTELCELAKSNDQRIMRPGANLWDYLLYLIVISKLVKANISTPN